MIGCETSSEPLTVDQDRKFRSRLHLSPNPRQCWAFRGTARKPRYWSAVRPNGASQAEESS